MVRPGVPSPCEVVVPDPLVSLPPQRRLAPPPAAVDGSFLHVRWTGGGAVVVLSGEVDLSSEPRLAAVGRLLAGWDQRPVVDASGVTFLDVAGLGALSLLAGAGGSLLVVQPSACVLRLLHVLALAGCGPAVRSLGDDQQGVLLLRRA